MPTLSTIGAACARAWGFTSGLVKDQYFNLVSLLLPGNGTNGAQNNTFLDGSTNNFTITRNGNTTQGTFSPFSQTGWGNYFNGSSYLQVASNAAFAFGTGDFSIEFWFYPTVAATQRNISFPTANAPIMNMTSSRTLEFGNYGISTLATTSNTLTLNAWNFCAASRVSGTLRLFINGVQGASVSDSTNFVQSLVNIGTDTGGIFATGYMADVRIVKGSGFTTSTVPTAPLTAISGTSLLTCQSNRFRDASGNGFTVTTSGSPSVVAFSPFAPTQSYSAAAVGGSGYFDGTGDYLTAPGNTAFDLGSGDFTIEAWIYKQGSGQKRFIDYANGTATAANFSFAMLVTSSNVAYGEVIIGSTVYGITGTTTVINTWTHVALVRNGTASGNLKLYVNGVAEGTAASLGSNAINTLTGTPYLSISGYYNGAGEFFNGYVSSARIIKGTALYTGNFTPSTAPFTAVSGTSLLLNFTNAGVVDATAKNVLETVGTAQISNGAAKFGTTSIYLNGDGNYLTSRGSPVFSLNGDFTMEAWVYPINAGRSADAEKYGTIVSCSAPGVNSPEFSWFVRIVGSSITEYFLNMNGTTVLQVTGLSVSLNAWHYFAVTRSGTGTGNLKLYIDGNLVGTSSGASTQSPTFSSSQTLMVGRNANSSTYQNWLSGYFQGVRITPGYVRTVTTVPTAPFPVQ